MDTKFLFKTVVDNIYKWNKMVNINTNGRKSCAKVYKSGELDFTRKKLPFTM